MIGYLSGKVKSFEDGKVILLCSNIGFEITCSASIYNTLTANGEGEVYIYTAVREDDISLYGFSSIEEKNMFNKLISVSGVGPKMGIAILSELELSEVALYIATSNVNGLSKVKGLGKKTAERIIVDLREKISQDGIEKSQSGKPTKTAYSEMENDAIIALMGLGFKRTECEVAVNGCREANYATIEQLITACLKNIR